MGEAQDCVRDPQFSGLGWLLQEVCAGFLEARSSFDSTHPEGHPFHLVGGL